MSPSRSASCCWGPISGAYGIYHKAEMRSAGESETRGLEEAAVLDVDHVIARIISELRPKKIIWCIEKLKLMSDEG